MTKSKSDGKDVHEKVKGLYDLICSRGLYVNTNHDVFVGPRDVVKAGSASQFEYVHSSRINKLRFKNFSYLAFQEWIESISSNCWLHATAFKTTIRARNVVRNNPVSVIARVLYNTNRSTTVNCNSP